VAKTNRPAPYYKPVVGSREIQTSSEGSASALKKLERAAPGVAMEVEYAGERLHRGPMENVFPIDLYDKMMPGLDALEQAVLGHLARLSSGAGQDFARVGKKELIRRTGLSPRRLLKALAGLAEKGLIRPLHRDTNGTLYKMYTVNKLQDIAPPKIPSASAPPMREKPLESPVNEEVFPGETKVLTMKEIAREFFDKAGKRPSDADIDSALAQITYLLEDGFTREEVRKAAVFLAENFGKKADIQKLPYYIHQVIKS
jgi:hypothetical protein